MFLIVLQMEIVSIWMCANVTLDIVDLHVTRPRANLSDIVQVYL
jgi:hypothetical protein